jgi:hypothetical protein
MKVAGRNFPVIEGTQRRTEWRWRDSNPRAWATDWGFSGRSR